MLSPNENGNGGDPEVVALQALIWILGDEARGERLLSLTGLDADQLRERVTDPSLLRAAIDFLCAHEPDLLACADALEIPPERLAMLGQRLNR